MPGVWEKGNEVMDYGKKEQETGPEVWELAGHCPGESFRVGFGKKSDSIGLMF